MMVYLKKKKLIRFVIEIKVLLTFLGIASWWRQANHKSRMMADPSGIFLMSFPMSAPPFSILEKEKPIGKVFNSKMGSILTRKMLVQEVSDWVKVFFVNGRRSTKMKRYGIPQSLNTRGRMAFWLFGVIFICSPEMPRFYSEEFASFSRRSKAIYVIEKQTWVWKHDYQQLSPEREC